MRDNFVHGIGRLQGVALVAGAEDVLGADSVNAQGAHGTLKPFFAVRIVLGEDGDAIGGNLADSYEVANQGRCFLAAARSVIEDVAIGWVPAEKRSPLKGAKKSRRWASA